jgi:ribosome-associated translation inhibitor RaiA
MRDEVPAVNSDAYLEDAMKKMADGNFSSVVVVSEGAPKGVVSATDVFKKVLKLTSNELDIVVSGLREDEERHLEFIKNSILNTVNKYAKSFEISELNLHFKKGKSIYSFQLRLKVDNERISVSSEQYNLKESVDSLCLELHNLLGKRKSKFIDRKLGKHVSGD